MVRAVTAASGEQTASILLSERRSPLRLRVEMLSVTVTSSSVSLTSEKRISFPSSDGMAATATGWKKRRAM
ncbi:hypothetical protein D3C71_1967090 [compost metagenome]